MNRRRTLNRAAKACEHAVTLYDIARYWLRHGDLCQAGSVKLIADRYARSALVKLEAAQAYLPADGEAA